MTTHAKPKSTRNRRKSTRKPMTPEEFKAEIQRRGWTYSSLALRWGVSDNWISKIARNENRPLHWDDAVRGLPLWS